MTTLAATEHALLASRSPKSSSSPGPITAGAHGLTRLREFVGAFAQLLDDTRREDEILARGATLLGALVAQDDWLPAEYAAPEESRYQQYLLHCDSRERFSVVSFVWGPGQATPVHDHTVWGLIGMLRGAELSQSFRRDALGKLIADPELERLIPGSVSAVSPTIGDVHQVRNAFANSTSISIHVYGANIGRVARSTYDSEGRPKRFVSGYANRALPNLWSQT